MPAINTTFYYNEKLSKDNKICRDEVLRGCKILMFVKYVAPRFTPVLSDLMMERFRSSSRLGGIEKVLISLLVTFDTYFDYLTRKHAD